MPGLRAYLPSASTPPQKHPHNRLSPTNLPPSSLASSDLITHYFAQSPVHLSLSASPFPPISTTHSPQQANEQCYVIDQVQVVVPGSVAMVLHHLNTTFITFKINIRNITPTCANNNNNNNNNNDKYSISKLICDRDCAKIAVI